MRGTKKLRLGLMASAAILMLSLNASWAAPGGESGCPPNGQGDKSSGGKCFKAPEIDAGAGSGALALLIGGLLLAAEKRRRSV